MSRYKYVFTGVVHPERADVLVQDATAYFGEKKEYGDFSFSVFKSKIAGIFKTSVPIPNPRTGAYWVERSVRCITDSLCFTNGCAYDVEVTQMIDVQTGKHLVFGIENPIISALNIKSRLPAESVAELLKTSFGIYLERSLSDLREALRNPKDSEFFCYRAIECLVHYFMYDFNKATEKKQRAWEFFRQELDVEEALLRNIKSAADPIRHGNVKEQSINHSQELLRETWLIVEKFINYASLRVSGKG